MIKRAFDLLAAVVGLFLTWPLWLVLAALIKLDSRGPVFFTQMRVGKNLKPFSLFKFRTMVAGAETSGISITVGADSRITRVGRWLRRTKLDELPQLLNILKGEMSIVGPRPEVPRYVELFRNEFADILVLRPGLTDLASLKYLDEAGILACAEQPEIAYCQQILPEKIGLARLYVRHASVALDLAIIVQTLLKLLGVPFVFCDLAGPSLPAKIRSWSMTGRIKAMILKWRRPLIIMLDIGLIIAANYLAFWLRFDGEIPSDQYALFVEMAPWLVAIRGMAFVAFRLNEGLWRYVSMWDMQNILAGVTTSTVAFYVLVRWGMHLYAYPRSIFVIDTFLLIGFVTGVRLPNRILRDRFVFRSKTKALIVGAGDSGERIAREMRMHPSYRYRPIGFVDDDPALLNQRIHGVKVLGTLPDLQRLVVEHEPHEVILAIPGMPQALLRKIVSELEPFKVTIKILPGLKDVLADHTSLSQIRSVDMSDLLPRAEIRLDANALRNLIQDRRIMITGAGGSIGSELARQTAGLQPEALVLFERHENSLYTIAKQLEDRRLSACVHPVIGDVTDARRLSVILKQYRPHIIFHAAAHKHVPLVEMNITEAIKNNCMGTRLVAEAADRFGVERFVLISTDKAVNPTSVMGASKRVAELIVQDMARHSRTCFLTVRFGNVLGSSGSVLLRFQEQIKDGGPVTVTHPEIRRYFMLIPEAVHLVMQAASLKEQGAIYVLDMGEQIKVLDLARNLIRLSGFLPGREIPIRFVGLRPGEKLHEELVGVGELVERSSIDKILRIRRMGSAGAEEVSAMMMALEAAAYLNNGATGIDRLHDLVPDFHRPDTEEDATTPDADWVEEEPAYSIARSGGGAERLAFNHEGAQPIISPRSP
ncbi:hypothetical protein YTPLAS18_18690 [Nitrospira sp.]|nr:hypothetical protein YTPLAS18_18690 [Nitrospira sp.]